MIPNKNDEILPTFLQKESIIPTLRCIAFFFVGYDKHNTVPQFLYVQTTKHSLRNYLFQKILDEISLTVQIYNKW